MVGARHNTRNCVKGSQLWKVEDHQVKEMRARPQGWNAVRQSEKKKLAYFILVSIQWDIIAIPITKGLLRKNCVTSSLRLIATICSSTLMVGYSLTLDSREVSSLTLDSWWASA